MHRDVKPENMVIGRFAKDVQPIYIINYELCRKYLDERKNLRPLREKICFRGSPRYASIDALLGKDQERVDDMWSWFQSVIEMTVGKLPFNDENGPSTIVCGKQFLSIANSLHKYHFMNFRN